MAVASPMAGPGRSGPAWLASPGVQLALCVLLPALLCLGLYQIKQRPQAPRVPVHGAVQQVEGVQWQIESIRLERGVYRVTGWAADTRNGSYWMHPRLILQWPDGGPSLELRANTVRRPDINARLAGTRGLEFAGFSAHAKKKRLPAGTPRILLSLQHGDARVLLDTGAVLEAQP